MTTTTPADLHQYADAIDHAAAIGGWVDDRSGHRRTLTPAERQAWARDAAVIRQAAYAAEEQSTCPTH